ncbi:hypothetical protein ACA910_010896 [Epithemia clementina (nom. ined.)]
MVVANKSKSSASAGGGGALSFSKLVIPVLLLVVFAFVLLSHSGNFDGTLNLQTTGGGQEGKQRSDTGGILKGEIESIPYYHCSAAATTNRDDIVDIVLLHGAKFTKEDWKRSGILQSLCQQDRVRVTALDLTVSATYKSLVRVLQSLTTATSPAGTTTTTEVIRLPVAALVTPSASGFAIVSAIEEKEQSQVAQLTRLWVPVASGSVKSLTAEQLHTVRKESFSIWAIHGDQDAMGQQVSTKLKEEAGAEVMEFPGPHPFYLDIPEQFSRALLKKLGVDT